ncbi:MAG: methyl-accepting chemotaxis protein [Pseudomonadota bacterium]
MLRMNDLPLLIKVSLAPAIAFVILLALALFANFGLTRASGGVGQIVDNDMKITRQLAAADSQFKELDGDLYRLITLYAAGDKSVELATGVKALKDHLAEVRGRLDHLKTDFSGQVDEDNLNAIEAELVKYGEAIDVVTSMLEIDFASAVSFIQPFRENAAKVASTIEALAIQAQERSDERAATIQESVSSITITFLVTTAVAGLMVAALAWLIGRKTSTSITEIAKATARLADGDRAVDVNALARKDELGTVVDALRQFREQMLENDRLQQEQQAMRAKAEEEEKRRREEARQAEQAQRAQEEERRRKAEEEKKEMLRKLADAFDLSVSSVVKVVQQSAGDLDTRSAGVKDRAVDNEGLCRSLSSVADDVSGGMQVVATATEELSSSISEISRRVNESSTAVKSAVERTRETNNAVLELASTAERIGQVVTLINDIASQTNLLALNATIEAARAGEAGKGFAVVASEVKNLAGQTAKATDEIAEQVESVQSVTDIVVKSMKLIGETIDQVNGIAADIAAAVEQQAKATDEIAHTVSAATSKISTLSGSAEELTRSSVDNGDAASNLIEIVAALRQQFDELQKEANGFVEKIRAA